MPNPPSPVDLTPQTVQTVQTVQTLQIHVRFFASLREALGPHETVQLPWSHGQAPTVGQLRDALIARGGAFAQVLARGRAVRASLNQVLCDEQATLPPAAEVGFFPPVTGG